MSTPLSSAQEASSLAASPPPSGDKQTTADNPLGATLQLACPLCGALATEISHATHPQIGQAIHLQLARWGTFLECHSCRGGVQIKRQLNRPRNPNRPPGKSSS